jgi:hypothetical protein
MTFVTRTQALDRFFAYTTVLSIYVRFAVSISMFFLFLEQNKYLIKKYFEMSMILNFVKRIFGKHAEMQNRKQIVCARHFKSV